jgi:uncharacterized protein
MSDKVNSARRTLLVAGALAAGGCQLTAFRNCQAFVGRAAAPLEELRYGQVRLDRGPLDQQMRDNHRLLLGLDEDALLRPYRVRAGQVAPGRDLGGWYDTYAFAPGATFGQWISALSRYFAITGDAPTRGKVARLVRGYAATIDADGSFYRNNRFPAYIYDKLVGGLVDARMLAGDELAVAALARTTRAAVPHLPPHALPHNDHARPGEDFSQHAWDESYTLPENQFRAWRLTGNEQHRLLARRFLYDDWFAPLARGENVLPGKHAYSHVNALSSAVAAYLSLGTPMHLRAACNGFEMISAQSYATGGWGPDEHFVAPDSGELGAGLDSIRSSFETPCGAYAHFKLTRYLLRITRDARYGDSMERVLYNTVLGALPIQPDGRAFYYSDYTRTARKSYFSEPWPCCSGTLPMIAADYGISTCFTDARGIYVNLFVPAQVRWRQDGAAVGMSIQTEYPYNGRVLLRLQLSRAQEFSVNLRIPAWAEGASLRVNGMRHGQTLQPGTFAALWRVWKPDDEIELELPMELRLQGVDASHPDTVAVLAGPLVLMRVFDDRDSTATATTRAALLTARRPSEAAREWRVAAGGTALRLKPFVDVADERYSAYQDVASA